MPASNPVPFRQRSIFWGLVATCAILLLWTFSSILTPFVFGAIIAYLLDPIAAFLERKGLSRLSASLIILSSFVLILASFFVVLVPVLFQQGLKLSQNMPAYVDKLQVFMDYIRTNYLSSYLSDDTADMTGAMGDVMKSATGFVTAIMASIWASTTGLLGVVSLLFLTPVVAFYLLLDWPRMIAVIRSLIPKRATTTVEYLAKEMDRSISGFIRGQSSVCLILGVFYAAGLGLVGLNFGLLIGFVVGMISFIPYVGSITGLVLSIGIAIFQFWPEWQWIAAVAAIFFVGQFIEGNILQPKLVGGSIGVHPVWLMLSLLAFGSLLGFIGLLMAVPLAATVSVLVKFAVRQYRMSDYYINEEPAPKPRVGQNKPLIIID